MMQKLILAILVTFFISELIKTATDYPKKRKFSIFTDGGMPSTHTAVVSSLATGVFILDGLSTTFLVALMLAAIVMKDAATVRLQTGEQSKVINKLAGSHLSERVGHTKTEVLAGCLLAIFLTTAVMLI